MTVASVVDFIPATAFYAGFACGWGSFGIMLLIELRRRGLL